MRRKTNAATYRLKATTTDAIVAMVSRPGGCTGTEIRAVIKVGRDVPAALKRRGVQFECYREGRTLRYIKTDDPLKLVLRMAEKLEHRRSRDLDEVLAEELVLVRKIATEREWANGRVV